jgi:hypothetical protein
MHSRLWHERQVSGHFIPDTHRIPVWFGSTAGMGVTAGMEPVFLAFSRLGMP